jgi:hypothetical protein
MVHCDNRLANRIVLGIFGTGVGVAVWLIAANTAPSPVRSPCAQPSCFR